MKSLSILILLILINISGFCQNTNSHVKMSVEYPEGRNFTELLNFQNIEMYDVFFTGRDLKGKYYAIIIKEIWDGKIKSTDTLINSAVNKHIGPVASDTLKLTAISGKSGEKKLKLNFRFDRFGISREFKSTNSTDYSLRAFGEQLPIEFNKPFYAFACILPYEDKKGSKFWCAVESSGKDIESWGKEFGIKHYILYEMIFFDANPPVLKN